MKLAQRIVSLCEADLVIQPKEIQKLDSDRWSVQTKGRGWFCTLMSNGEGVDGGPGEAYFYMQLNGDKLNTAKIKVVIEGDREDDGFNKLLRGLKKELSGFDFKETAKFTGYRAFEQGPWPVTGIESVKGLMADTEKIWNSLVATYKKL